MSAANTERLMQVLLAPVVSEKSTFVGEKSNQGVFKVAPDATKPEIKAAVELLFSTKDNKVQVTRVCVSNVKGKNPLKDRRVRQAFYQAIDIEAIRSRIMRA